MKFDPKVPPSRKRPLSALGLLLRQNPTVSPTIPPQVGAPHLLRNLAISRLPLSPLRPALFRRVGWRRARHVLLTLEYGKNSSVVSALAFEVALRARALITQRIIWLYLTPSTLMYPMRAIFLMNRRTSHQLRLQIATSMVNFSFWAT